MKQLVLLSGKGGTGKTTVAASFVMLAQELVPPTPGAAHAVAFADCDVDACNLHLVFSQGKTLLEEEYRAGNTELTRLNEAQRDLVNAETSLATYVINMHNAKAQLMAATGEY